jgi:hypothetical protein
VVRSAWPWRQTTGTTAPTWLLNVGKRAYIEPRHFRTWYLSTVIDWKLELGNI